MKARTQILLLIVCIAVFVIAMYLGAKNRAEARIGVEESNRAWLKKEVRKIIEEGE